MANLLRNDIMSFEDEWKTKLNFLKKRFGKRFDANAFASNYKKAKLIISKNMKLQKQVKPFDDIREFEDKWKTKLNSFKAKFGKKFNIKLFVSNYKKARNLMLANKIKVEKDIIFKNKKINLVKFNLNNKMSYKFRSINKILLFKLLLNLNNRFYLLFKGKKFKSSLNKCWNKLVYEFIKLYYVRYEKKRRY